MRYLLFLTVLIGLACPVASASLSRSEAKKLISRMAGAQLSGSDIRVNRIVDTSDGAEASADLDTAFSLKQDLEGRWKLADVRIGPAQWENVAFLFAALNRPMPEPRCTQLEVLPKKGTGNLTIRRARCVLAQTLGIELPSDAVRIRDISSLGLPFSSSPSAVVAAQIRIDVRFGKEKGGWWVVQFRSGSGDWINVPLLAAGVNEAKARLARQELATIAGALEEFRKDSGFYVTSDRQPVLIDHLSPRYLTQIIRLDPWHNPYRYQGERDHFVLRSTGPDGKENTSDDIVVTGESRQPPDPSRTKPLTAAYGGC